MQMSYIQKLRIQFEEKEIQRLEQDLMKHSRKDFDEVASRNARALFTYMMRSGNVPVDKHELRPSASYSKIDMGFRAEHGPHVEYGHRTRNGGYVPGQYYLQNGVNHQRPLYKDDLKRKLRE